MNSTGLADLAQGFSVALELHNVMWCFAGVLIERLIIRYLYGRPLETLLATWGVSLILQQTVRTIFGANNKEVTAPDFMSGSVQWGGLSITAGRLWIVALAILVFVALQFVLRATPFGLRMRASWTFLGFIVIVAIGAANGRGTALDLVPLLVAASSLWSLIVFLLMLGRIEHFSPMYWATTTWTQVTIG